MPDARRDITGESPPDAFLDRCVGGYRLVERVGEGGMGAVYRAVPTEAPHGLAVAVKLIKRGMDTAQVLRRFDTERHILAALDHPNIARLLDTGTTADGLPYVVMEYVPGLRVVDYCDQRRLPVAARLELFRKICAAVEAAHGKQVIHRDIKPSNILVGPDGEPKLLDFGIAKVLDRGPLELPAQPSQTQAPVMTPQYASPEQARGEPVTPASDIYSLGVLLYELLTGHRPYRVHPRSAHDVIRAISEQTPERPSTAVLRSGTASELTPETVAAVRCEQPEDLCRTLAGGLDAVVLKTLRKHPARRYPSAAALSEDIGRYLEGRPVKAPRPGPLYGHPLARRWLLATVLVALLAAGASLAWRASAGIAVRPSVAVLGFENLSGRPDAAWLSTAFAEVLSADMAAGGRLRAIPGERVEQAKQELGLSDAQSLAPAGLARLHGSLDADFVVMGSYFATGDGGGTEVRLDLRLRDLRAGKEVASSGGTIPVSRLRETLSRTALPLRRRLGAGEVPAADQALLAASLPDAPEAARYYCEGLEGLRRFDTLGARERFRRTVAAAPRHALSHAALAGASAVLGYDPEARSEAKQALDLAAGLSRADRLRIEGRYYQGVRDWDRAVATFRALQQSFPDDPEYGLWLADVQSQAGQGRRALETLAALRTLPGAGLGPRIDLAEAEAAFRASDLARARDAAARAAASGRARGLRILAARAHLVESRVFIEMGDPQHALAASAEARTVYEAAGIRQGVAWAVNDAAAALTQLGEVARARASYEQALDICRATGDQTCIGTDLDSIGVLLRREGDLRGALRMHEQALAVRREVGDLSGVATALYNIGNVRDGLGDLHGARQAETESLDIRRSLLQKRAGALTMSRLADVRRRQGELLEALAMSRDAVSELRSIGDRGGAAMGLFNLSLVLFDRGDLAGSRAAGEEALAVRRSQRDKNNTAQALWGLADVALAEDRLDDARRLLEESMALRQDLGERIGLAQTKTSLAALSLEQGDPDAAERLGREAAAEFARAGAGAGQAEAETTVARALSARRVPQQGRHYLDSARSLLRGSTDCKLLVAADLAGAELELAVGRVPVSARLAERALSAAGRCGFPGLELEARLALARAGRAPLAALAADAAQAGYKRIARKAGASRE